jgi:signal transduction histidine kinase
VTRNLSLANPESMNPATTTPSENLSSVSGAELVLTQDRVGQCFSFSWRDAKKYGIASEQVIGKPLGIPFEPVAIPLNNTAIAPYNDRVRQVLETLVPLRFDYPFRCGDHYIVFDLTISPIFQPQGTATIAVVVGNFRCLTTVEAASEFVVSLIQSDLSSMSQMPRKRLTEIVRIIRRNLNLETIWRQTVDGLGETLGVSRCLICPYKSATEPLRVVAEYRQSNLNPLEGFDLLPAEHDYCIEALTTLQPAMMRSLSLHPDEPVVAALALPTLYKDQPNGLLILHQSERLHLWDEAELEVLKEIADQVGTAIAHATLLEESRTLTQDLQLANENLTRQHREVEEARQQAEAASRLKSEFLANTSHELRTPLNGVIGFIKLIMDGMADDPEEQQQFLQEAYRSAIHLLSIINDILDIAKIEAGKMQLDLNPVPLDDLLNDVDNFIRPQTQQKALSFEIRTPATRDEVVVNGNYQRLLQVMLNLLGNAIKFTHEGEVTVTAEILPKGILPEDEDKPGFVKISVADTGIGVSLEKQDKLFQSFSQVDGSRTRQYGGTGLGLAISQKLVEAMGGVVNFYSMGEGLGSTVTFTVPLYQDPVMISTPIGDSTDLLR